MLIPTSLTPTPFAQAAPQVSQIAATNDTYLHSVREWHHFSEPASQSQPPRASQPEPASQLIFLDELAEPKL